MTKGYVSISRILKLNREIILLAGYKRGLCLFMKIEICLKRALDSEYLCSSSGMRLFSLEMRAYLLKKMVIYQWLKSIMI